MTEIVQLVPFVAVVQSPLVEILTVVGAGAGFGVAPFTAYTEIVMLAVLDEMYAGLRTLVLLELLGIRTLTVAWVRDIPLTVPGIAPGAAPPPPPHAAMPAANTTAMPKKKK
ncbi:MAG TPA: hypothetical protein VMF11_14780 [Candidatus Baltobacteraceae bacterium]|nr:hypothetical protein [Candidatus Baltobacteraceae bacterium]